MIRARLVVMLVLAVICLGGAPTLAQEREAPRPAAELAAAGETITYQGMLRQGGAPADGTYDFQFSLYAVPTGGAALGTVAADDVPVAGGLFTAPLTFGEGLLNGEARWLELAVKADAGSTYTVLSPRQRLTAAPLALALPGLWTHQNDVSANLIGGYDGNVLGAAAVGVAISGGGAAGNPNRAYDQYGVVAGGANNVAGQSGASNDQPYAVVGGGRGNAAGYAYSTVGGGFNNAASELYATVGGGFSNVAAGQYGAVAGGANNTALGQYATVGGGGSDASVRGNKALDDYATIGGGTNNTAGQSGDTTSEPYATVGGGQSNVAGNDYAFVGGGQQNTISAAYGAIGGGQNNAVTATLGVVAGGQSNIAGGSASSIGGGANNLTLGPYPAIGGGYENRALNN
ncbi:MAG TPA: hypothetical protein VGE07_03100, partial [Herpetosiphonaceae bacterium]